MTDQAFEGEIDSRGAARHHLPARPAGAAAVRGRVSAGARCSCTRLYTIELQGSRFARGEMDLILTTEAEVDPGGEMLAREPLVWVGAQGGQAWRSRPLRFGSTARCVFRRPAIEALERGRASPGSSRSIRSPARRSRSASPPTSRSSCSSRARCRPRCELIRHGGALPELPEYLINMYVGDGPRAALAERAGRAACARPTASPSASRRSRLSRPAPPPCRWRRGCAAARARRWPPRAAARG